VIGYSLPDGITPGREKGYKLSDNLFHLRWNGVWGFVEKGDSLDLWQVRG
jgi:hypothetical protein